MASLPKPREAHLVERTGWLRAAVLGANDGIVSTASLIVGVAAAAGATSDILVAGTAGLVAGAMSMAAGEYVSVSSQADSEAADLDREQAELLSHPEAELRELTAIYVARGVTPDLAREVATQMMAEDALGTHLRDELGLSDFTTAKPIQAALTSAATFTAGAALPLAIVFVSPLDVLPWMVSAASLVFLAVLGGLGGWVGGAPILRATLRVTFWGALAMALTAGIGLALGTAV